MKKYIEPLKKNNQLFKSSNNFIFLFILVIIVSLNSFSQVYDFPIKPGSDAWKALNSHDDMIEACMIPNSQLKDMNTQDLFETCLNYPLLYDFLAFDNLEIGLKV